MDSAIQLSTASGSPLITPAAQVPRLALRSLCARQLLPGQPPLAKAELGKKHTGLRGRFRYWLLEGPADEFVS